MLILPGQWILMWLSSENNEQNIKKRLNKKIKRFFYATFLNVYNIKVIQCIF